MSNEVVVDDFELESFLAQLDEENEKLLAEAATKEEPSPQPVVQPAAQPVVQPVAEAPVPQQSAQPDDFDLEAVLESVETPQATQPAQSTIGEADMPDAGVDHSVVISPDAFPTQEQMVKNNLAEVFKKQREAIEGQPAASETVVQESAPAAPVETVEPIAATEIVAIPEPPKTNFRDESAEEPTAAVKVSPSGLQHFVDVGQFRRDIRVNDVNLDSAMFEQSGLRAFYGANAAYAEAQHSKLKLQFEVLEAQLFDHHRKALAATGEKVTEKMVESAVKMDKRWLAGKNKVIEAETIADIAKTCVSALVDRRDMIIQIGADRRDEGKGALRILAKQQAERNSEDAAKAAIRQAFGR